MNDLETGDALDILSELEDIVSHMKPPRPFGAEVTRAELDNMFDDIREYIKSSQLKPKRNYEWLAWRDG